MKATRADATRRKNIQNKSLSKSFQCLVFLSNLVLRKQKILIRFVQTNEIYKFENDHTKKNTNSYFLALLISSQKIIRSFGPKTRAYFWRLRLSKNVPMLKLSFFAADSFVIHPCLNNRPMRVLFIKLSRRISCKLFMLDQVPFNCEKRNLCITTLKSFQDPERLKQNWGQ